MLSYEPREVCCLVNVRIIGALINGDERNINPKILLVDDARFDGYKDISDVHPHKLGENQGF